MKQPLTPALARVFKRLHYPFDVTLRWAWFKPPLRISLIVTSHFANNVTGFSTRLRGV